MMMALGFICDISPLTIQANNVDFLDKIFFHTTYQNYHSLKMYELGKQDLY